MPSRPLPRSTLPATKLRAAQSCAAPPIEESPQTQSHHPLQIDSSINFHNAIIADSNLGGEVGYEMQEVVLDGIRWRTADDVYDSFFKGVGSPDWHGRNFNALRDSIVGGRINNIDVPYVIRIKNYASIQDGARLITNDFVELIKELQKSGCPIEIEVED